MTLQILQSKVVEIHFEHQQSKDDDSKQSFGIDYKIIYDKKLDDVFAISFNVSLKHPTEFNLTVDYITWFKTSNPVTEEFKNSFIPKENAPAIAFPFLRSFIATLTLNSGYKPAILPSINFIELRKQQQLLK